jgi:ferredoxin-NADP reductase
VIVSRAGDWTKSAVEQPRRYYWVKGTPKPGVLGLSLIFKRVVIVTTGSGIGPCLSIIASPTRRTACRILWTGPRPEQTFGSEIVRYVRRADPEAMIIDSKTSGRPDMVALSYRLYVESGAEAVFVISNPALTRKIVYSLESRGVPAYGPIWDS